MIGLAVKAVAPQQPPRRSATGSSTTQYNYLCDSQRIKLNLVVTVFTLTVSLCHTFFLFYKQQ